MIRKLPHREESDAGRGRPVHRWAGLRSAQRRLVSLLAVFLAAAAGVLLAQPASAAGPYGPDTCLQGFVWRDAKPGDHVCVTPATRAQTAYDNSQAAARRSPFGGPFGKDTCRLGYVWRGAFPGDHVCVTPATRTRAATDNSLAAARRATLHVTVSTWAAGPVPLTRIARIKVLGDHFNVGPVRIVVSRARDGRVIAAYTTSAVGSAGKPGGTFEYRTQVFTCPRGESSLVRVYDTVSKTWSGSVPFTRCGFVF